MGRKLRNRCGDCWGDGEKRGVGIKVANHFIERIEIVYQWWN